MVEASVHINSFCINNHYITLCPLNQMVCTSFRCRH